MSQINETFFTAIGCMDGRCQEAVKLFGQDYFGGQYQDTITEAGLVKLLSQNPVDPIFLSSLKKKIDISINIHHSKGILVYGHQECAPLSGVNDTEHKENVLKAANVIRSFVDKQAPVIPLFVKRDEDSWESDWTAEEINEDNSN